MNIFRKKTKAWSEYIKYAQSTDISDIGERVEKRLVFTGINQETLRHVRESSTILQLHKAEMVNLFYEQIMSVNHLKGIIMNHSTVDRLRKTMEQYIDQFLQADVNRDYIRTRIIIGSVHSRIHLTAEHFISAHHVLIQIMTSILMEKMRHKPDRMMETVLAVQKLAAFDQQLIVEVYMEETIKSFLFDVSGMLDSMTGLETTKQLIVGMNEMIEESHSVTSATEEVSASIMEVAAHSVKVAERTDEAVYSAEQSKQVINEALGDIEQVGLVYKQVVIQVNQLNEEIEQTHKVVDVIRDITDQTNLLALNASIEAARAGEHGKGFAVVAAEVQKLAEHTKEQTMQITKNMENLQKVSQLVTDQMGNTGKLVEHSVTGATQADKALEKIVSTMHDISQSTSQIAAMTEEQTSAVMEIAERSTAIFDLGTHSQEMARQTAEIIFDLSKEMDEYRKSFFVTNIKLTAKDVIKVAKTDHLLWKWKVYNVLLGIEKVQSEQITSHKECRLGEWYYGTLSDQVKKQLPFQQLEEPHQAVHHYAKEAMREYEQGYIEKAYESFRKLEEASSEVIALLIQLEKSL
ncbi:methyl-accepting chemotaxis protein [Domibacillus aminovorans]|uniref:Chemotaxis protein n=1 Tax=Domibacillus aminovorans TaxID=29332 RepID=A0A177L6H0_9BACI|nr:methyl-accepting chemotaxis protein [Domibacillus aminovorans]OAH60301.1 chemotaxis protein [Domibacillus aminovorans]